MDPVESRGTAVWKGGGVEGWVGSAGVGGAGVWREGWLLTDVCREGWLLQDVCREGWLLHDVCR